MNLPRIIISDDAGREIYHEIPICKDFLPNESDSEINSLDKLCRRTPFGAYLVERQSLFEHISDGYLMREIKRSFLKKKIPPKNDRQLKENFMQIEKLYGVAASAFVLERLLVLLWLGDLFSLAGGWAEEDYQKGIMPLLSNSNKLLKKKDGKRKPADLRSLVRKKIESEQRRFDKAFDLVLEKMGDLLNKSEHVFLIEKYQAVIARMEKEWDCCFKKIEGCFERPVKTFVCRTLNRLETSEKKSPIPPARRIAGILKNAVILNPKSKKPFTETDIRSLARGCLNYL